MCFLGKPHYLRLYDVETIFENCLPVLEVQYEKEFVLLNNKRVKMCIIFDTKIWMKF